ncbi:MAG: TAXI family TRAP transporter solute-binding subunit [Gemmatimonadales bacterium]
MTGPPGSAYDELGARYQEVLRHAGIDLRVIRTEGGVENLARLQDPTSGVKVGFLESGLTSQKESPNLLSLGTVSLEPLWTFFRGGARGNGAREKLTSKRISIEPQGSSTRVLARRLLALNGIPETSVVLLGLPPEQSAEALLHGEIDGTVMLSSWRSPVVRRLLVADGVVLESYPRADAYVALFPSLSKVVLPTGVADLARNIPPRDVTLLAVETSLVVRKNLHPALQYLLLEAASEIQGGPDIFHKAGRFPAAEAINLPLSTPAREFYQSGLPFVYQVLPLWLAGITQRLLILLIPLFILVFPAIRFLPAIYSYMIERRIYRLYGDLMMLEAELDRAASGPAPYDLAIRLEDLAKWANHLSVPLRFSQRLFILKSHIAQTRDEVEKRQEAVPGGGRKVRLERTADQGDG